MKPTFATIVCPWTPENPRHDHQLIFPLSEGRLMFVWCEYFQDDEAIVTYYTRVTDQWARDSEVTLKIFQIGEFYR